MALGLAAVDPGEAEPLGLYLSALVAARGCPVHVAVAFNAVFLGYDVGAGGYVGGPLELDAFPSVSLGDATAALPVGAMVNVRTGAEAFPAEVVYKEGAHPLVDAAGWGELPSWVSGAPGNAAGPGEVTTGEPPVLRERLVIDTDAFGHGLSASPAQLRRMRRKGRWVDPDGHVLLNACYDSETAANLSDIDFYARFMSTAGRTLLLSPLAPAPFPTLLAPGAGHEQLESALKGVLRTLRDILRSRDDLRMHGDYAVTRGSYAARLADDGPLGRSVLEHLAVDVARSAVPRARRGAVPRPTAHHTAVGPALRALHGTEGLFMGLAYPTVVSHANLLITDYVRSESDEETGLLDNGVYLRLDDAWQSGGVWRAECPGEAGASVGPDEPGGRGWRDTLSQEHPAPAVQQEVHECAAADEQTHTEVAPPWLPDDSDLGVIGGLTVANSQIDWTQPLRLRHILDSVLPLPTAVAEGLRGTEWSGRQVRLELDHAGHPLPPGDGILMTSLETDGDRSHLCDVDWPLEFVPGMLLTLSWVRGGGAVRARTTLLDAPILIDGEEIRHRFDARVRTRDTAPGNTWAKDRWMPDLTPKARVLRAVRIMGLLDNFGRALFPAGRLAEAIARTSPGQAPMALPELAETVDAMLAAGDLTEEWGSQEPSGKVHHPVVAGQPKIRLLCYTPRRTDMPNRTPHVPVRPEDHRPAAGHRVHGHLRRIGHLDHRPSHEAREAYRRDRELWGLIGSPEIPPGYTYVLEHRRGS
ncbi:hypothetical protein [Kitasatospora sp. NE20-6]|uniref:hypothetical protein n=1 Tax=Kitasatospora sp. NE20-6 TaxID=2859066 RepID=UPI0038B31B29